MPPPMDEAGAKLVKVGVDAVPLKVQSNITVIGPVVAPDGTTAERDLSSKLLIWVAAAQLKDQTIHSLNSDVIKDVVTPTEPTVGAKELMVYAWPKAC